jgi:photosystem II stability/assembly factor-like uncharacterized protein
MKKTLTILLILFLACFVNAQRGWQIVHTNTYCTRTYFLDTLTGFININFSKTTDGGYTWTTISVPGLTEEVREINFLDKLTGFAGCSKGTMLKTTDGGNTWKMIATGDTLAVTGITFTNDKKIFIANNSDHFLCSTDYGTSWSSIFGGVSGYTHTRLSFYDDFNGVAIGPSYYIATTSDGGSTWTDVGIWFNSLFDVKYFSKNALCAIHEWGLEKSTDGGKNWSDLYWVSGNIDSNPNYLSALAFYGQSKIWILAKNSLYFSGDAGSTWNIQNLPSITSTQPRDVFMLDSLHGWVISDYYIYKTTNGGYQAPKPNAPSIIVPLDNTVNINTNVTLQWSQPANTQVISYHLQVATDNYFSNIILDDSALNETTKQIHGLKYNYSYYWRVCAQGLDSISNYTTAKFSTQTDANVSVPVPPTLIYPLNDTITDANATVLQWKASSNTVVDYFHVQVAYDSTFTSYLAYDTVLSTTNLSIKVTSTQHYYWRVSAKNSGGESGFSLKGSFNAAPLFSDPSFFPLRIGNQWYYKCYDTYGQRYSGVTSRATYYAKIKTIVDSLANGNWKVEVKTRYPDSTTTTHETWQYYDGIFSEGGEILYQNYLTSDVPSPGSGAPSYTLAILNAFGTTYESQQKMYYFLGHEAYSSNKFTTAKHLGKYYSDAYGSNSATVEHNICQLVALKADGVILGDSTCNLHPQKPTITYPLNGSTDVNTNSVFYWNGGVDKNFSTRITQLAYDSSFTALVGTDTLYADSVVITGLRKSQKYYWRVKGVNNWGDGPYSDIQNFTTNMKILTAPTVATPSGSWVDTVVAFSWTKPAGEAVNSYRFQMGNNSEYNYIDTLVTDTCLTISGLSKYTNYYWHVCASNATGDGPYSDKRHIYTERRLCIAPTPVNPPNNGRVSADWVTFKWLPTYEEGTRMYVVQIATDTGFTKNVQIFQTTSPGGGYKNDDSMLVASNLKWSQVYYWRVSDANNANQGPYSEVFQFTTLSLPLTVGPSLASASVSNISGENSVTFRWYQVSNVGVLSYQVQIAQDSSFSTPLVIDTTMADTSLVYTKLQSGTTYYWRVRAFNMDYSSPFSSPKSFATDGVRPNYTFALMQNYPNPFNPSTTINYEVPEAGRVSMRLYGVLGNEVATLIDEDKTAGNYDLKINLSNFSSGVYIYRLRQGANIQSKKLILLK